MSSFGQTLLLLPLLTTVSSWNALHLPSTSRRHRRHRALVSSSRTQVFLAAAPQQLGSFETLSVDKDQSTRRVLLEDWLLSSSTNDDDDDDEEEQPIKFEDAWKVQREFLQQHSDRLQRQGETDSCSSFLTDDMVTALQQEDKASCCFGGVDRIIFLEHAPVYTLGTASDSSYITNNETKIPIVRMDRGGEVTYHGPGQLVVYPVLDLRHYSRDIHWFMRALEEAVLLALQRCGMDRAQRQDDTTGVWIDNHKVAAMGVKCRKWITQHGLAVNVEEKSLQGFEGIVPCGLEGRAVGCVNQFLDRDLTVQEFATYMKSALEEVFCIKLVRG